MEKHSDTKKNIVVFDLNWLGDIIFSLPNLAALKKHYPKSHLACIVPPVYKKLVESQAYVDEVIGISDKNLLGKLKLILRLRKTKWDMGILLHRSKTRARIFQYANIPQRIGFKTKNREHLLTESFNEPPQTLHKMDYLQSLLKKMGIDNISPKYSFNPPSKTSPITKPYVVLHPGSNWEPKRWPARYYAALGDMLVAKYPCKIVITGKTKDRRLALAIQRAMRAESVNLVGQTSLSELAALFYHASIFIGGDTGPMHLASAINTPVIALYGPTSPLLSGPRTKGTVKVIWEKPKCRTYPCSEPGCNHPFILNKIPPQRILDVIESWGILQSQQLH